MPLDTKNLVKPDSKNDDGVLLCHRFMIPMPMLEQSEVPGFGTQKKNVSQMNFVPCIKMKCTRWNRETLECRDNTDSKTKELIAESLFKIAQLKQDEQDSVEVD